MTRRTDLAVESVDFASQITPKGVKRDITTKNGIEITTVIIEDEHGETISGKPKGRYVTIETSDFKSPSSNFYNQIETIAEVIETFLVKNDDGVLIVGLGNREITPDALGPKAADLIFTTRHIEKGLQESIGLKDIIPVSAIAPGVLGQTGIETAEIVTSVVESIKPSCIIAIDALAAGAVERLATTIQISDTGISPGSGVQNKRKELSKNTIGIPVIAIGIPMVVDMTTIAKDLSNDETPSVNIKGKSMIVTPREIDLAIEHAAKTIAYAVNKAIHPHMELDDLIALVG